MAFYNDVVNKLADIVKQLKGEIGVTGAMPVKITDGTKQVSIDANNRLNVHATVDLETVTATNLTIKDATTANQLKVNENGAAAVELTGSYAAIRTGVTGVKTITSTPAEVFAGSSARLNGRWKMVVRVPLTATESILYGLSAGTCNIEILPGNAEEFTFDPGVPVPIYAKTNGGNVNVQLVEVA